MIPQIKKQCIFLSYHLYHKDSDWIKGDGFAPIDKGFWSSCFSWNWKSLKREL